jgi:hypothetical protein
MGGRAARTIHGSYTWDHNARRAVQIAAEIAARRTAES